MSSILILVAVVAFVLAFVITIIIRTNKPVLVIVQEVSEVRSTPLIRKSDFRETPMESLREESASLHARWLEVRSDANDALWGLGVYEGIKRSVRHAQMNELYLEADQTWATKREVDNQRWALIWA